MRSSALNCTKENGYTCLPNENFTELLEFCYTQSLLLIEEGNWGKMTILFKIRFKCYLVTFRFAKMFSYMNL